MGASTFWTRAPRVQICMVALRFRQRRGGACSSLKFNTQCSVLSLQRQVSNIEGAVSRTSLNETGEGGGVGGGAGRKLFLEGRRAGRTPGHLVGVYRGPETLDILEH